MRGEHVETQDHLMRQLRHHPRAEGPHVNDRGGRGRKHRAASLQRIFLAAHYVAHGALLSAAGTAAHCGIEHIDALRGGPLTNLSYRGGTDGAVNRDYAAAARAGEHAVVAQHYRFELVIVDNDHLDDVAVDADLARGVRRACALRYQLVDRLASEVMHHQIEPAHRDVDRERFALFAQPD